MKWHPAVNAVLAFAYIGAVSLLLRYLESTRHDTPDTIVDGIGFISLVVFSASVMAFLFFYQPLVLLLERRKREAASYSLKTIGIFGAVTVLMLILVGMQ